MTETPIKVDIWVDIVCPFSYVATSRMAAAVAQVAAPVDIEYHSFQLMPDLPEDYAGSNAEFFRDHRGIPPEELAQRSQPLIQMTAEAGLPYRLEDIQQASTLKAHRADVERSLVSEQHLADVRADTDRAGQLGIQVVPFFIFQDTYSLSGAQEIETLVEVLVQMRNEATMPGD